jgi:hypothetical protein
MFDIHIQENKTDYQIQTALGWQPRFLREWKTEMVDVSSYGGLNLQITEV